jgi:hypothetical protein
LGTEASNQTTSIVILDKKIENAPPYRVRGHTDFGDVRYENEICEILAVSFYIDVNLSKFVQKKLWFMKFLGIGNFCGQKRDSALKITPPND